MIKEYLLTIILGAILGFGVTGGYFALNKSNIKQNPSNISPTPTSTDAQMSTQISITPAISENKSTINIISPEDNTVLSTSKTSIKGDAKPNSLIVITTSTKTYSDKANSNGVFSIDIDLDSGINLIKISSIDSNDNQDETEVTLTYSSAKI